MPDHTYLNAARGLLCKANHIPEDQEDGLALTQVLLDSVVPLALVSIAESLERMAYPPEHECPACGAVTRERG